MRLSRRPGRRSGDINLISLINVVFLILVFFMIMGRIAPDDVLSVDPPAAANATAGDPGDISILLDPGGRIAVNAETVELAALPGTLTRYASELSGAGPVEITLKADGKARFEQIEPVIAAIRGVGVTRLSLATDTSR